VFALDEASGVITVADMLALDFESVQALTLNIQVTDGLFFDNAVITINLLNVNEPPSVADKTLAIKENTNANAVISVLQGTDPDNGQILYYSIKGGNTAGAFAVNALTGEISVDNPIAVNFEDVSTFNLIVSVSDGQYSDDAFIVINLTDVNEPPVVMGAAVQFGDTLRDGEVIHLAVAADEDAGDMITYSIASGSEFPLFTIDSQTGEVMIAGLQELVPGAFTYEVLITATDGRGLSGTGILVVGIEKRAIWPEKGFSPNGDETNDFWRIDGIEGFPDNTVKVYNRWGHQVTEVSNYDNNERVWRGEETQVSAQIESTYFFIIRTGKFRPITGYVIVKP
jgi:gliding motility-associated-like protein